MLKKGIFLLTFTLVIVTICSAELSFFLHPYVQEVNEGLVYDITEIDTLYKTNSDFYEYSKYPLTEFLEKELFLDVYGIAYYTSVNSQSPYGGNDSSLWQGSGVNVHMKTGGIASWNGISISAFPVFYYIQNKEFQFVEPVKAPNPYSYYISGIDYPQRMGNEALLKVKLSEYHFGYQYKKFFVGLGAEQFIGSPAIRNPILFSNNAPPFPKLSVGFEPITTPIGNFEGRVFWGKLTKSEWFDYNEDNNHTFITGFLGSYTPNFIPGFTLGVNRVMLSPYKNFDLHDTYSIFLLDEKWGKDDINQLMSLTFEWKFPDIGFSAYAEWGRDDFSSTRYVIIIPEHTAAYTLGFRQVLDKKEDSYWMLSFELSQLIKSRDYEINSLGMSPSGFYGHGIALQGFTQEGQIIGSQLGPGIDAQYLTIDYVQNKISVSLDIARETWNKNYIYGDPDRTTGDYYKLPVDISVFARFSAAYTNWKLWATIGCISTMNYNYTPDNDKLNVRGGIGVKYLLN